MVFRVLVLAITLIGMSALPTKAVSVGGFPGTKSPGNTVSPLSPTDRDEIFFTLNADFVTYTNPCWQLLGFGVSDLQVAMDETEKDAHIMGEPISEPSACVEFYFPVTGLQGSLGILPAGDWTLYGLFGEIVNFTVGLAPIPGDFDGDSDVDGVDLAQWEASYGVDGSGDTDGDGDTDGTDFLSWQQEYTGPLAVSVATVVPEPTSLVLVGCAVIACCWRRRGRGRRGSLRCF